MRRHVSALRDAVEYRVWQMTLDFLAVWALTGNPKLAGGFTGLTVVYKTFGFYLWRVFRG